MRRNFLFPLISMLLLFSALSYGQAWSGVLAPSRAIDWSHAGLPATLPDGETTANPWTPPAGRTQCVTTACQTVTNNAGGSTPAQINAAIASAPAKSYVLLPPGTYAINSNIVLYGNNYVTLRGSGPMSTILNFSGSGTDFQFGVCCMGVGNGALSASSYPVGTTSMTITGVSSAANLTVGNIAWIQQCDTGWTGSGINASYSQPNCTSGSYSDPGGIWVCGIDYPQCTFDTAQSGSHTFQKQNVLITGVTNNGGGSYKITFSPGLYMPNWSSGNNAQMIWQQSSAWSYGMGVEDMTANFAFNANEKFDIENTYGWWVKGLRITGYPTNTSVGIGQSAHGVFSNNYIYGQNADNLSSNISEPLLRSSDSDNLLLNNIITGGICVWADGQTTGDVIAYNFCRDTMTGYYISVSLDHLPYESFLLTEGNQFPQAHDDDTHGTHDLDTYFRNYLRGWDSPYVTLNPWSFTLDNYQRFDNIIGNVLGGPLSTAYQGTSSGVGNVYVFPSSDTLAQSSVMRWGNCDVINAGCRFVNSEVPTNLSAWPNSVPFQNSVPSGNSLPCSFFISSLSSSPCTVLTNGGTGLSWWRVCTNWSAFPTSCSAAQAQPFPPIGPEESGGPYVNGHAYDIPAAIAFGNLPIDASLQQSYSITSSSWASGTETLTVSGLPNLLHLMGGFQIVGVPACNSAAGGEFVMTSSSATTVSYALAANPGNCGGGTMKFPDVRQFDERVYQADSGGNTSINPPTGLSALVQ
jgi:hypothetical protein